MRVFAGAAATAATCGGRGLPSPRPTPPRGSGSKEVTGRDGTVESLRTSRRRVASSRETSEVTSLPSKRDSDWLAALRTRVSASRIASISSGRACSALLAPNTSAASERTSASPSRMAWVPSSSASLPESPSASSDARRRTALSGSFVAAARCGAAAGASRVIIALSAAMRTSGALEVSSGITTGSASTFASDARAASSATCTEGTDSPCSAVASAGAAAG